LKFLKKLLKNTVNQRSIMVPKNWTAKIVK